MVLRGRSSTWLVPTGVEIVPERRPEDGQAARPTPDPESSPQARPLTDRELEILMNVARGMTNRQIGAALGISPLTVRNHMRTIQRKLSTADRTQAVVMAIGNGWIPIQIVLPGEGEPTAVNLKLPAKPTEEQ